MSTISLIFLCLGVVAFIVWVRWPMTEGFSRTTRTPERLPTATEDSMFLLADGLINPGEWRGKRATAEELAEWPANTLLRYRVWHSITENRPELGRSVIVLSTVGATQVFPERALRWIAPGISWELGHHCGRHAGWFFVHSGPAGKPILMSVEFAPGPRSPLRRWQIEAHERIDSAELDRVTGASVDLLAQ